MCLKSVLKHLVSSILIAGIVFSSFAVRSEQLDAASGSRAYKVFNATTGTYITQYYIPQSQVLSTGNNRDAFIPYGNNANDYNMKKGVVKLMSSNGYLGTGFIVDDYTIATAAHCLIGSNTTTSNVISDILLFDNNDNIVQHATPEQIHIPTEWYNFANGPQVFDTLEDELDHWTYDYGLITVEQNLSGYMHYKLGTTLNSFYPSSANSPLNKELKIIGYPYTSNDHYTNVTEIETGYALYYTNSSYYNPYNALLYYSNEVTYGYSGSPIYFTETYNNHYYNTVIGIHTAGNDPLYGVYSGVKFSDDHLTFYLNNPYLQ